MVAQLRDAQLVDPDTLTALLAEARRQRRSLRQVLLSSGVITLYRGLPYDLPLGVLMYTTEYSSSVPALSIKNRRERHALLDHKLRTREEAVSRLRQLERSEVPR